VIITNNAKQFIENKYLELLRFVDNQYTYEYGFTCEGIIMNAGVTGELDFIQRVWK